MRIGIIIGTAISGAILAIVATVCATLIGVHYLSLFIAEILRLPFVVIALAITAFFWCSRLKAGDRPESVFFGLMGAWMLDVSNLNGHGFVAAAFTESDLVSFVVDLLLWAGVSFALVTFFARRFDRVRQ